MCSLIGGGQGRRSPRWLLVMGLQHQVDGGWWDIDGAGKWWMVVVVVEGG